MIYDVLVVGPIQANCYLLGCRATRRALVLDAGDEPDRIAGLLARHGLRPEIYLHTHGHIDHVGATASLKERFGGEILLHRSDLFLYEAAREHALFYGIAIPKTLPIDRAVEDGERISWGEVAGTIRHTPGHSPGGICLHVESRFMAAAEDWVFTGDTLFRDSVGRSDLPGGSWPALMRSIREKLLPLPDVCVVAPGHGPLSTIGRERSANPYLQDRGSPEGS